MSFSKRLQIYNPFSYTSKLFEKIIKLFLTAGNKKRATKIQSFSKAKQAKY